MAALHTAGGIRRLALLALAAGTAIAGSAAVLALLTGSFGESDGRIIAGSVGFGVFSATAATGAAVRLRPVVWARVLGVLTMACSVVAFVLLLTILGPDSGDAQVRTWLVVAIAAFWTSHASVVLGASRSTDRAAIRLLTAGAVAAMTVAAIGASLRVAARARDYDIPRANRELAAVLVAALVASILLPILRRLVQAPAAPPSDPAADAAAARLAAVATTPQLRADLELLRGAPGASGPAAPGGRTPPVAIGIAGIVLAAMATLVIGLRSVDERHTAAWNAGTAPRAGSVARPAGFAPPGPAPSRGVPAPEPALRRAESDLDSAAAPLADRGRVITRCRNVNDGIVVCDVRVDGLHGVFSAFTRPGRYDPRTERVTGLLDALPSAVRATRRTAGVRQGPRALLRAVRPIMESCRSETRDATQCTIPLQLARFGAGDLPVVAGSPAAGQAAVTSATVSSYTLTAPTAAGASFTLARAPGGHLTRTCTPVGAPGCRRDGTW